MDSCCSSNRPREKPTEPIQTFDIFKTRCTFNIEGKEDGTGIANASLNCSGPGTPVTVIGSNDLDPFAAKFMVGSPAHEKSLARASCELPALL